jgi:two-component system response regulator MprA
LATPLILIADDERALADALADFLASEGFRVHVVHDGLSALDQSLRLAPSVVLSDMQMPRLDGQALVRHLRAAGSSVPVVLMSAVLSGVDLPGTTFLPKPFDLDDLLRLLDDALRRPPNG